jgi:hypothetical protein
MNDAVSLFTPFFVEKDVAEVIDEARGLLGSLDDARPLQDMEVFSGKVGSREVGNWDSWARGVGLVLREKHQCRQVSGRACIMSRDVREQVWMDRRDARSVEAEHFVECLWATRFECAAHYPAETLVAL